MIISHKHKFIFIKTIKTAGTSIEFFLEQFCDEHDHVTPIYPPEKSYSPRNYEGFWNPVPEVLDYKHRSRVSLMDFVNKRRFYNHIQARQIRHRIPKSIWNTYFKFTIERNPWDKVVSHYSMLNHRAGGTLSFNTYLANKRLPLNYPIYCDAALNPIVDKIIHFEKLEEGMNEICSHLGLPFDGLNTHAKKNYRADKKHYSQHFDTQQAAYITKLFEPEINLHNYQFESQ